MVHLCIHKIALAGAVGVVFILLGTFLGWFGFPYVLNKKIAEHITMFPGSEAMERWMNLPFPLEFKVYFFNITNADQIQEGLRPKLKEIGPYVFDLYKSKVNVTYNKLNDTFTYLNRNKYYFNAKKSYPNKENDLLVLLNVPLMGTATMVEKIFPMGLSFVNTAIPYLFPNITNMFITATAKEFMYDGIFINCSYNVGPAMPVCNGMRGRLPATISPVPDSKNFKFSFFKHKNESLEGPFTVIGGNKDIYKVGKIIEFKSSKNITVWEPNTTCSLLRGTDSTVFPPMVKPASEVFIFVSDICLSLSATLLNQTLINGIPVYKYESSDKNFANSKIVPENICRCSKNEVEHGPPICLKKGAIDANNCQGAPVIFTEPHFLGADPEYSDYVEGVKPDHDKHTTFVLIEPRTGTPVVGRKRMQMNMFLRRIQDITILSNVSEGLFPIAWVEEGGQINDESMKKLYDLYYVVHSLEIAKWIIICLGILLTLIALVIYAKYRMIFCFNGNKVSQFGYTVNAVPSDGKTNRPKRSALDRTNDIQTISNKLYAESKLNDSNVNSVLPS